MADSGGHWSTLAEAQKLSQSHQTDGFIEEDIKRGGLFGLIPVWQLVGKDLIWLREQVGQIASLASVGSQLVWTDNVTYDKRTLELQRVYAQAPLDHFVSGVYKNINDYEAIQLMELKKAVIQKINDLMIYGDVTYGAAGEFDGIHALSEASAADFAGTADMLDIDQASAGLSLKNLRDIEDRMKYGIDFWLFPYQIANRLDAYVQEAGLTNTFGAISFTLDQVGKRVTHWNGVPIVRSDYLVAETANTGRGSNLRSKNTSGASENFSVFAIKAGNVARREPGLTYVFGGNGFGGGEPFRTVRFEELEDFDAAGLRLISYASLADGSAMALARINDITDVAIVA